MSSDDLALVVGVGASAGGLQAFRELLKLLEPDNGSVFLLVQHLDPNHESLLSELLCAHTSMPVRDAEQGAPLCADTVYVISPGSALGVRNGRIELTEPTLHRGIRLPVDHLFRSIAREYGSSAVGIVLSGAGSDGSAGLRDIKGAGGLTIAQEPQSSGQRGMPSSAIETGLIDLVLEIDKMPQALERFATLPQDACVDPPAEERDVAAPAEQRAREHGDDTDTLSSGPISTRVDANELSRLKALLAAQIDFDLGVYKSGTVERRVLRRMLLSGFENVGEYIDSLRERTDEQQTLVRDLLISVTSFFRDAQAHETLRKQVIKPLISHLSAGGEVRAWVAGCATGEEAYSLGMTILDAAAEQGKSIGLQIFATDVDQEALSYARQGIYPSSIAEQVSVARRERYFQPFDGQGYRVGSTLRDCISFAEHDLTRDPPFSRMDIVSCRNVLIYLTPDAQRHVLGVLHFALRNDAHLVLGTSESPGASRELFTTLDKSSRLYRKNGNSRALPIQRESRERRSTDAHSQTIRGAVRSELDVFTDSPDDAARRAVLDVWAPPTIVVSGDGNVLFMHGELGPFLRFPQGDDPHFSLDAMLRRELVTRTRGALYRCRNTGSTLSVLSSPDDGRAQRVRITATPAPGLGDSAVLLGFQELSGTESDQSDRVHGQRLTDGTSASEDESESLDDAVVVQLESELQATREDLRNTVEELETSSEELRSSNEESMSMNEELQSANEELEASTEELRSLNEELSTVNAQLREKVEQLEQVNDDLGNFFTSARVAVIFLDDRLRIKRFTPAAEELLGIDRGDVGRFTGDLARDLLQRDLEQQSREVLAQLETRSIELQTHDGRWFVRRVLPYHTGNRRIEGVVVTLLDITETRSATERLAARERQQRVIARLGLDALGVINLKSFMDRAVEQVRRTLDLDLCKILELQPGGERLLLRAGTGWREGLVGSGHVDASDHSQAGYTLAASQPVLVEDLASDTRFSGPQLLVDHDVASGLSVTIGGGGQVYGILAGHSRQIRRFAKQDADFLQAIANVIGSTVDHWQTRLRTRLESAVASPLTGHANSDDALAAVQRWLCAELGTIVSEIWLPNEPDSSTLELRFLHTIPGERREVIEERLRSRDVNEQHHIVARVLEAQGAVGATDIGQPPLFNADENMKSLGFTTAFAFPVRSGRQLLGVITLYAHERLFVNETLLRSLEGVGQVIGDSLVRARHERRAARMAAITESSHDALFSHDLKGRVIDWLPGAERLYGYSASEMIGASVERLVPEVLRVHMRNVADRIKAGETIEPFESVRYAKDGTSVEVSVRVSPILDTQGNVVGITSTDRDIGALKLVERKLLAADQHKDEFLAMLGHELRNPLASIRTAVELLGMNTDENEEVRHARLIVERQSTQMSSLLDGLLDVSRIVNGKVTLDRRRVDLVEVCRAVLDDSAERAAAKELTVEVTLPDAPVPIDADYTRLTQILDNLMSNAIRYTPIGGSVSLAVTFDDRTATIRVRDDGIGIDSTLLPHVFDVFRQSIRTLDRAEGGLGLGLSLVRSLVLLHDGSVDVHSDGEGCGAEFIVRLPIDATSVPLADKVPVDVQSELRVLLIEDNPDTADVMCRVLVRLGHVARTTTHGERGVEMVRESAPDVVICDLGLPGGYDGYDVVRALRADPDTRELPIAALSGYGRTEDKSRSEIAGFDMHLTKPISLASLRTALADLARIGSTRRKGQGL